MIFRNKLFAASPTAPTVLEGKVIFCGTEMGFWSPPSAPSLHGIAGYWYWYCVVLYWYCRAYHGSSHLFATTIVCKNVLSTLSHFRGLLPNIWFVSVHLVIYDRIFFWSHVIWVICEDLWSEIICRCQFQEVMTNASEWVNRTSVVVDTFLPSWPS